MRRSKQGHCGSEKDVYLWSGTVKKHHQKHFVKRGLARAKIYTFGEFSVKVILQAANCIYTYRRAEITARSRTTKRKGRIGVQFMFLIPYLLSLCPLFHVSITCLSRHTRLPMLAWEPNSSADADTKDAVSVGKRKPISVPPNTNPSWRWYLRDVIRYRNPNVLLQDKKESRKLGRTKSTK